MTRNPQATLTEAPAVAALGRPGTIFPDAALTMPDGRSVDIDRFRVRWNLVLLLLGEQPRSASVTWLLSSLVDAAGAPAPALFVADRYREIYAVYRDGEPQWPPTTDDVLEWPRFVNLHCAECNLPEW